MVPNGNKHSNWFCFNEHIGYWEFSLCGWWSQTVINMVIDSVLMSVSVMGILSRFVTDDNINEHAGDGLER